MRICIWFEVTDSPWGGGNQFLRALSKELVKMGHEVTHRPDGKRELFLLNAHNAGPDLYLHPGQVAQLRQTGQVTFWGRFSPARAWLLRNRRGPVIVHRLDGVAELIRGHRTKADDIQPAVNRLADYTIFQSLYCKETFAEYGVRPTRSCVIHNGVDPAIFHPRPKRVSNDRVLRLVAVSWSPNPRKGFATLARMSQVPGVELRFLGQWCPSINPGNVIQLGSRLSQQVGDVMRDSDAMIHAAENEPCSNAILEALACGLPVLFRDSGGNGELAAEYGVPLTNDLTCDIARFRMRYKELREKLLDHRHYFLITRPAKQYVDLFQNALEVHRQALV